MDVSLRRDVWVLGSVCLLSSSLLWRAFRCAMARGGRRRAAALEDTQAQQTAWSPPGLEETAPVKGRRTAGVPERCSPKNQPPSERERVTKLNESSAEKTHASAGHTGSAALHAGRPQGEVEGVALRKPAEPRGDTAGSDGSRAEGLSGRGKGRDESHTAGDGHARPASAGGRGGPPSQADAAGREPSGTEGPAALAGSPHPEHRPGAAHGDRLCERCVSSVKAVPMSEVPGHSAGGPCFQIAEPMEPHDSRACSGAEERPVPEDRTQSRVAVAGTGEGHTPTRTQETSHVQGTFRGHPPGTVGTGTSRQQERTAPLDDSLAPPAPFDHRIVTARQTAVGSFYTVSRTDILGGGRFGQVHKCEEKATGLQLAAKIIKTRSTRDKDDVKNEITVMNQLDHVNLIQLYDAFESKSDIVLVMEYVGGGELFDRIIDDSCNLTELDTILFIKQICEGIRHMHQMYILHLDLKPENILCVNRDTKQIKIIDFGLARRYKPRERLKVSFGTPEFLAPEVVNYDFVSFPTDMWSVGVIAYMLLSGLSPFLGDNDAETLNNVLACRWDLEEEEFRDISEEAREFLSKLLIKEKSWRMSAGEALKHPWLSDPELHARLSAQGKISCFPDAREPVTK